MEKIKVLVADDHAIVRMGLVSLLGKAEDIEVVGEANSGAAAVSKAVKLNPDVAILDLAMPKMDGVAATAELHAKLPEVKVLILTSFGTSEEISNAFAAGAHGAFDRPRDVVELEV